MSHTIKSCAYILVLGLILKFRFCCTHEHDKKHWFYGIFCFFGPPTFFKKDYPFQKVSKRHLRTISCCQSLCSGGYENIAICTLVADKNHNK